MSFYFSAALRNKKLAQNAPLVPSTVAPVAILVIVIGGDEDIVSTGWLRYFPGPALTAYTSIWSVSHAKDGSIAGDLDDLAEDHLHAEQYGGLDTPYDPANDEDADEEGSTWSDRWAEWQGFAAQREMPMQTYRDVFEFMARIGLLVRDTSDDLTRWRPPAQVPLAEDVLPLSEAQREVEARIRWRDAFGPAASAITRWLVDQRVADETVLTVATSISDISTELDLDLDDARHGLACAVSEAGDMWATPDPESALLTDPIQITVDWQRFDAERIAVRLNIPGEA